MIARRRCPSHAPSPHQTPRSSGPRCASVSSRASPRAASVRAAPGLSAVSNIAKKPHMVSLRLPEPADPRGASRPPERQDPAERRGPLVCPSGGVIPDQRTPRAPPVPLTAVLRLPRLIEIALTTGPYHDRADAQSHLRDIADFHARRPPGADTYGMPRPGAIQTSLTAVAVIGALAVVSIAALRLARADAAQRLYRERLADVASRYESLRSHYNTAVRETAVTELVVEGDTISVTIRTLEGETRTIETPFSPDREIYVDFALVGGRLWIRRVFDADTPPSSGVVIDTDLTDVDWESEPATLGRAVYRTLSEGRWVVATTGDGALTLAPVPDDAPIALSPPPELSAFDELESDIDAEINKITAADVVGALLGD